MKKKERDNILLVTPVFEYGGTETYIITLTEFLKQKNITPIVLSDGGAREKELHSKGIEHVKVSCFKKKSIKNAFVGAIKIMRIVKNQKIRLVHASSVYTSIISKLAALLCLHKKVKVIMTLHGGPTENIERKAAKILNFFADKVITLSQQGKELLVKNGLSDKKVAIINNGIKPIERKESAQKDKIIIGSCGRLTKQKGYEYLIEAAAKIDLPNVEFWIAGDGDLRYNYENLIREYNLMDKFKLLGFREDVSDILNNIDIFILPSLWEPFGISIIEAISIGKPVIATKVGGISEVLGDCGILIKPANVDEIVESIKLLAGDENLRKSLGQKAEDRFNKYFTQEIMGEKTISVYKEVLNK